MGIATFDGHEPVLGAGVFIHPAAEVIGDVVIGAHSSVWPMTVVRGDVNHIRIGDCTNIQDGCVLHVTHGHGPDEGGHPLLIGNEVTVGHGVILHGCSVGDRCLIGMGARVLDGAVIQTGAMVAAGSLVSPGKVLEGGFLWLGSPVRRVRPLNDKEIEYLRYSAQHYVHLKDRYLGG